MLTSAKSAVRFVVFAAALAMAGAAQAQQSERPPTFDIGKVRGFFPTGDNYTIKNPVRSDGLLRVFTVETPYGVFTFHGDQMLRMRLNELAALHELDKISNSESYGKALLETGLSPLKYTGKLITNPGKTMSDTFSGIGTMFDRFSSDIGNMGKAPGDPIKGLLGITDQRRKLATKVGVDPYSDFEPLDAKLARLSEASAAGGLTVSVAMLAVPIGVAGIVVSNLSTASTLEGVRIDDLARDRTAPQIFDLNRQALRGIDIDHELIEALLINRNYTPVDMAVIVANVVALNGVEGRDAFLTRVSQIDNRTAAYFVRRNVEMLRNHQARGAGFTRFEILGGYPLMITRTGRIVGVMPIDALSWTPDTAKALRASAAAARRLGLSSQVELRITGTATPLAKKELAALGWHVVENVKF